MTQNTIPATGGKDFTASGITIITNNIPRNILGWGELTAKEQAQFDYLTTFVAQYDAQFVRYCNQIYDLGEFIYLEMRIKSAMFNSWHGYTPDSYSSGTLVKYTPNGERVVMGRYCA